MDSNFVYLQSQDLQVFPLNSLHCLLGPSYFSFPTTRYSESTFTMHLYQDLYY